MVSVLLFLGMVIILSVLKSHGNATLDKYRKYTKKLSDQDITKGENLIKKGLYTNVLKYMLSENIKLEQEVIMN